MKSVFSLKITCEVCDFNSVTHQCKSGIILLTRMRFVVCFFFLRRESLKV